ncbi:MAG: hypothetical protein E6Q33_10040 [Neisseriales bacterium]|jgi:hypothetical protein|nr:MAG: hypothetical protein E6Q33_10040 [Neisseriales bacterium]
MKKTITTILLLPLLSSCALLSSSKSNQLPISGKFMVKMDSSASYNKEITALPISASFADATPFINNTIISKGLPLFGVYKNNGFSCTIIWTTITFSDGTTTNNTNGVAHSSCMAQAPIKEGDLIEATWN